MNNLKTLKNLNCVSRRYDEKDCTNCINCLKYSDDLKQEAIKWCKDLNQRKVELQVEAKTDEQLLKHLTIQTDYTLLISWIMNFFNLTEEDMKNG